MNNFGDKKRRTDEAILLYTSLADKQMPKRSQAIIARVVGCSREYVRQRMEKLAEENIVVPTGEIKKLGYIKECVICHKQFPTKHPNSTICGPDCSRKQRLERYFHKVKCSFCGKTKYASNTAKRRNKFFFCDKFCQGKWLANKSIFKDYMKLKKYLTKYPPTKQILKKALPYSFTTADFCRVFEYSDRASARVAVNRLVGNGLLVRDSEKKGLPGKGNWLVKFYKVT